jgi:hypothetical protein
MARSFDQHPVAGDSLGSADHVVADHLINRHNKNVIEGECLSNRADRPAENRYRNT